MLYINQIRYFIPDKKIHISQMGPYTHLSKETLRVFEKIYRLNEIPLCDNMPFLDFVSIPVKKLLLFKKDKENIQYLIHLHTAHPIQPFGMSIVQSLRNKFQLNSAIAFSTTMQKCVSALMILNELSLLLEKNMSALIVTSEIAFTPELRVIPRTSIGGDVSVAALVSASGECHRLIASEMVFLPGYSEGVYLTNEKAKQLDESFIEIIVKTIMAALNKASLPLDRIHLILPHNVNYPTWKKILSALSLPENKAYLRLLPQLGHCFASDGFLNLAFADKEKRLQKGDYYLMVACGIGFFFSCAVFQY